MRRINPFWLVLVVAFGLLAASCASDPSELVVGSDEATDDAGDDTPIAEDSPPVLMPTTTTTAAFTTTTVIAGPATTASGVPTTMPTLGEASLGTGDWALILLPDIDGRCGTDNTLTFVSDGDPVHLYNNELGPLGDVQFYPGTRGQDAFVVSCDGVVEQVILQLSAVPPDRGYPFLQQIDFATDLEGRVPSFDEDADWRWRGDLFAGFGTVSGNQGLWAFGIPDAVVIPFEDTIGTRAPVDPLLNVSMVVPRSWSTDSADGYTAVAHPTSQSRLEINRLSGSVPEVLPEGAELLSSHSTTIDIWSSDDDTVNVLKTVEATEYTFLTIDRSIRLVRHVPVDSGTVVIEMFADSADSSIDQSVPWLALELIQILAD